MPCHCLPHVPTPAFSHCADAVISLANRTTIVGDVAGTLSELLVAWTTTPSDYDALFAATVRDDWARRHRPVLSRGSDDHTLYVGFSITEPDGDLVRCHRGCGIENRWYTTKGNTVQITCKECGSLCTVEKVTQDRTTALEVRHLVKTCYPPRQADTTWRYIQDGPKVVGPTPATVRTPTNPTNLLAPPPAMLRSRPQPHPPSQTWTDPAPPRSPVPTGPLPTGRGRRPDHTPTYHSHATRPQPPVPQRPSSLTVAPPTAITQARSAPEIGRKRVEYPAVQFPRQAKRQKKK